MDGRCESSVWAGAIVVFDKAARIHMGSCCRCAMDLDGAEK